MASTPESSTRYDSSAEISVKKDPYSPSQSSGPSNIGDSFLPSDSLPKVVIKSETYYPDDFVLQEDPEAYHSDSSLGCCGTSYSDLSDPDNDDKSDNSEDENYDHMSKSPKKRTKNFKTSKVPKRTYGSKTKTLRNVQLKTKAADLRDLMHVDSTRQGFGNRDTTEPLANIDLQTDRIDIILSQFAQNAPEKYREEAWESAKQLSVWLQQLNKTPKSGSKAYRAVEVEKGDYRWKLHAFEQSIYHHQLEAVAWAVYKEKTFMNENYPTADRTPGGVIALLPGLGKTIVALALVVNSLKRSKTRSTLIVVPANLRNQWMDEIQKFCAPEVCKDVVNLRVGVSIGTTPAKLQRAAIVLASYEDVIKEKKILHKTSFMRIILDEGHRIRTTKTAVFMAIQPLQAKCRWILTGTPVVNSPDDFYAYWLFFRIDDMTRSLEKENS